MENEKESRMCGTCKKRKSVDEFYFIAKNDMEEMRSPNNRPLCLECKAEMVMKEKDDGKRQRVRDRNRRYRESHREQERARVKKWMEANKEKMREYAKKSREKRANATYVV